MKLWNLIVKKWVRNQNVPLDYWNGVVYGSANAWVIPGVGLQSLKNSNLGIFHL